MLAYITSMKIIFKLTKLPIVVAYLKQTSVFRKARNGVTEIV